MGILILGAMYITYTIPNNNYRKTDTPRNLYKKERILITYVHLFLFIKSSKSTIFNIFKKEIYLKRKEYLPSLQLN